jgi:Protein of unknown function (DUF1641)
MIKVIIDGVVQRARQEELLVDLIRRTGMTIPHVCYHPAEREKPVHLFGLLRRLISKDSLRTLAAAIDFIQGFGRNLQPEKNTAPHN